MRTDFDEAQERAAGYFQQALERDPTFAEAYFNLGKIALRRDELEQAIELLEKAVELAPDYKEALLSARVRLSTPGKRGTSLRTTVIFGGVASSSIVPATTRVPC